jgi:D-glycero-D-manno-heptose 1,7-bisphosphate phosphatase
MVDGLSPAVFIDRDGTLMRDVDYCGDPKDVEVFKGASEAIRQLKDGGYKIIVITNQSGIGRGYFDEPAYKKVEDEVNRQIGSDLIDATYFCPHLPEQKCGCRKPEAGMVHQAAREHAIDLKRSYFIGDKNSDMECGRRAGTKTILVQTGYGNEADQDAPDAVVEDLRQAVRFILNKTK